MDIIVELVGFGTAAALRQYFKQTVSTSTAEWRKHYRKVDTRVSTMLVAAQ